MEGRNVHIYNPADAEEFAGFFLHGRVQIGTFYCWLERVLNTSEPWALYPTVVHPKQTPMSATGPRLERNDVGILAPGDYIILHRDSAEVIGIFVIQERPRRRPYSTNFTYTPHSEDFTTRVRARDMRCCISGEPVASIPGTGHNFTGFEAAHIFPLSETDQFYRLNYDRFITDPMIHTRTMKINSVQQGFLCTSTWHRRFDDYQDGFRITDFCDRGGLGTSPVDGRVFYINPTIPLNERPSPALLRDHLRQCILANLIAAHRRLDRRFDPEIDLFNGGFDLSNKFWTSAEGQEQFGTEMRARLTLLALERRSYEVGAWCNKATCGSGTHST
ncbi:hypothetical protein BJV78DRAFT_1357541 [Lactifluus subvellereus]|nr:hypothetical protein BJV78DRAFT_1357541 [Lactifluus subvellereus]